MFSATDNALQALHNALQGQGDPHPDCCFRLLRGKDGMNLELSSWSSQDATFSVNGEVVLALSDSVKERCTERTLDIDANNKLVLR